MKELSIEGKATRYDKAVESLRAAFYDDNNRMCEEYRNAALKIIEPIFPELAESEDERIRKALIKGFNVYNCYFFNGIEKEKILAWLEKQGEQKQELLTKEEALKNSPFVEQKPADKVEPKFREGDWVVYKCDICKIVKREEGCNKLVTNFGIEKELVNERNLSTARLWTIEDAKDGDVLVASDNSIFLFKCTIDCACKHYVALTNDNTVKFNEGLEHYWETSRAVHPATKEQRDLLFQKMEEAGYKWDADKKKLGKIEQEENIELTDFESALFSAFSYAWQEYLSGKEVNVAKWAREHSAELLEVAREQKPACNWSEDDEKKLDAIYSCVNSYYDGLAKDALLIWLKSLKNRVQPQSQQEWSEEDGDIRDNIIRDLKRLSGDMVSPNQTYQKEIQWLKSLKPQWKPSDEQMNAFDAVLVYNPPCSNECRNHLITLYNELKKLREE